MSNKFSTTTASFGNSNLFRPEKQEQLIREIAQNEFLELFDEIKVEIETKIKSIDKNIIQIKKEISKVKEHNKHHQNMADVIEKLEKVEADIQILRYNQQFQMKASRARSFDKDRKPIFRKNSREEEDFGSLVLGLQTDVKKEKTEKKTAKKMEQFKPPSPKTPFREPTQQKSSLSIESMSKQEQSSRKQEGKGNRNPVLDNSASIHRWLSENNNKTPFSCFTDIIKEEEIEESLFY